MAATKEPWLDPEKYPIPPYAFLVTIVLYFSVTWVLRTHRLRNNLELFPYTTRSTFPYMTLDEAFHIQQSLNELEFPFVYQKALQFALFRTYGIPSISGLLAATTELVSPDTASKRYVDTEVLVAEFISNHPQSDRAIEAVARMNYLHNLYLSSGKITNEDLLYTLSLFALEPVRWIQRYEWRNLEEFERCAIGTFWKATGDAMSIDYSPLRSIPKDQFKSTGEGDFNAPLEWTDGFQWLQSVETWAEIYEKRHMLPHPANHQVAERTMDLLLWFTPSLLKSTGRQLVYSLMDERLRVAMKYPKPPRIYPFFLQIVLWLRKYFNLCISPPRPPFMAVHHISAKPARGTTDVYNFKLAETAPWYIKPTPWNRYLSPWSWITRVMGLPLPGDDGDKYFPQGYRIRDVGPKFLKGKGKDAMDADIERIRRRRKVGEKKGVRPFGRPKVD